MKAHSKKFLAMLLVLAMTVTLFSANVFSVLTSASADPGTNLLGAGVSSPSENSEINKGWGGFANKQNAGSPYIKAATAEDGIDGSTYFLLKTNDDTNAEWFYGAFAIELEPGTYQFSYKIKGNATASAGFNFLISQGWDGSEFSAEALYQHGENLSMHFSDIAAQPAFTGSLNVTEWETRSFTFAVTGTDTQLVRIGYKGEPVIGEIYLADFCLTHGVEKIVSDDINNFVSVSTTSGFDWTAPGINYANKGWYIPDATVENGGHGSAGKSLHFSAGSAKGDFLIELEPGDYEISYWVRGTNVGGTFALWFSPGHTDLYTDSVRADILFNPNQFASYFNNTVDVIAFQNREAADLDWTKVTKEVTVSGEGSQLVNICYYSAVTGDLYMSDIAIVKAEEPTTTTEESTTTTEESTTTTEESTTTVDDTTTTTTIAPTDTDTGLLGAGVVSPVENSNINEGWGGFANKQNAGSPYIKEATAADGIDGSTYFALKTTNDTNAEWFYSAFAVELEPGTYTFSYKIKGDATANAGFNFLISQGWSGSEYSGGALFQHAENLRMYFSDIDSRTAFTGSLNVTEWEERSFTFTVAGDDTQLVRIGYMAEPLVGEVDLADFALEEAQNSSGSDGSDGEDLDRDPDELLSSDIINLKYYYNPDTTPKPVVVSTNESALNRAWYMWNGRFTFGWGANTWVDSEVTHDGKPSLAFYGGNEHDKYSGQYTYFTLRLDPGTYELSYWYKYEDVWGPTESKKLYVMTEMYPQSFAQLDEAWPVDIGATKKSTQMLLSADEIPMFVEDHISSDWQKMTKTVKVTGSEPLLVKFDFLAEDLGGSAWFSDFSLKKADATTTTTESEKTTTTTAKTESPDTGVVSVAPIALGVLFVSTTVLFVVVGSKRRIRSK